jgi:peptidoglycan/xylan/chitin deacetylase (PgdA/CDA1 family)
MICLVFGGCASGKSPPPASGTDIATQTEIRTVPETASPSVAPSEASSSETLPASEESKPETTILPSSPPTIRTDYAAFSPNEMGRIPVVMFHKFVDAFDPNTEINYTNTFDQFGNLLETLYGSGFRLISMNDFLSGRISVPAGYKPMVFTFDDGTASQFSLEDADGTLKVKSACAVEVLRQFNQEHPDFGMKGIFFLTMDSGNNTFPGKGTLNERLSLLLGLGFEVGSHTWGHVNFAAKGTRADVEAALGRNQKAITAVSADIVFHSLALPYGGRPSDKAIRPFLAEGSWEGTAYRNEGVFAVGAGPAVMMYDKRFDPLYIPRVRATGRVPAEADLDWWLAKPGSKTFYVSDGDPDTLVIPEGGDANLVPERTDGLKVIRYAPAP